MIIVVVSCSQVTGSFSLEKMRCSSPNSSGAQDQLVTFGKDKLYRDHVVFICK
jgi:hypothetical protein